MNAQWEHKVLTYDLGWKGYDYDRIEQDLNELGCQGWGRLPRRGVPGSRRL